MSKFIRILGLALTVFFSVGAVLGAMVTMYTAVANRTREIGTLRALGFGKEDVLLAFVTESVLLGIIGGVGGVAAASSLQLITISTMNWQSFSELAFGFTLTPSIALYHAGVCHAHGVGRRTFASLARGASGHCGLAPSRLVGGFSIRLVA